MDKKSIIGIVLIVVIVVIFGIVSKNQADKAAETRRVADSIQTAQQAELEARRQAADTIVKPDTGNGLNKDTSSTSKPTNARTPHQPMTDHWRKLEAARALQDDSARSDYLKSAFGDFANAALGERKIITLENKLMKIKVLNQGGKVYSVELKEYKTHDGRPLVLFAGDSTKFNLQLTSGRRQISSNDFFFEPQTTQSEIVAENEPKTLSMRLKVNEERYIEYLYTIKPNSYMVDFDMNFVDVDEIINQKTGSIILDWQLYMLAQEKGRKNEENYTTIFYKIFNGEVESLKMRSKKVEQGEEIPTRTKWVAFKHQFFSTVIIADDHFIRSEIASERQPELSKYLSHVQSKLYLPYKGLDQEQVPMVFYFGPNKYKLLKTFEIDLQRLVPLGGAIVRPINKYLILPIFNFLEQHIANYGIIILILTIVIKILLLPFTYRAYKSQAKMRVLKPQVDEINERIPKEKAMERQKATSALYKKVGVSPLGGCLITALQFPILYAMFRFFPSSTELRQESFLWATDLSTYDAIIEWSGNIPLLGNHLSLFTILMTVTTILSMRLNNTTSSSAQMPGMKTMMYIMPVMFLFMFNSFSSGLTYYYFLANLITLGQNYIFRLFIDEEELLRKLYEKQAKNSKKGKGGKSSPKKKSTFMERLEKKAREQQKLRAQGGKKR